MRILLADKVGQTIHCSARFSEIRKARGDERNVPAKFVLLEDVKDEYGLLITDHTWIKYSPKRFSNIKKGTEIIFTARVEEYKKSRGIDYGFRHVRNISPIENLLS